jgi:hypothetical protein
VGQAAIKQLNDSICSITSTLVSGKSQKSKSSVEKVPNQRDLGLFIEKVNFLRETMASSLKKSKAKQTPKSLFSGNSVSFASKSDNVNSAAGQKISP